MKVAVLVGLFALTATPLPAQDERPPDFTTKTVAQWIAELKSEQFTPAGWALGPNGPYSKVAVPALIESFKDEDWKPWVIGQPASTLADYGTAVVPSLLEALKRPESLIRAGAAESLSQIRPRPTAAIPGLIAATKDADARVRRTAVGALGRIGRDSPDAVRAVAAVLNDRDADARARAFEHLGEMGHRAEPAVPILTRILKDKDSKDRTQAATVLGRIGPGAAAAVPALIEALRTRDEMDERMAMAGALGGIGPAAESAVPALIAALRTRDSSTERAAMASALGRIGGAAKSAAPALVEALRHPGTQREAAYALGGLGSDARAAVPPLIALAEDADNPDRGAVIAALGRIGPEARAAVPVLVKALSDQPYAAAEALSGIGPDARAAVPKLIEIARDLREDRNCRQAACEAVAKIDPATAARQNIADAYLNVRLGQIPSVKLAPRPAISDEKKKRIERLIAELAELKDPDVGLSSTLSGHAFAPLPGREQVGPMILTDHRLKPTAALRKLVAIGPDALPFLLAALADQSPTKFDVQPGLFTIFGTELEGNPLNRRERRVLDQPRATADDQDDENPYRYTLRVGDVCFVAIGQIVGRPYSAVCFQPSTMVIINSPATRKDLRDRVRAIWSSRDPAQTLLDSLLIDYATEGIFNDAERDGWHEASDRQVAAGMRLLYYFPREATPLIADRLKRLDVSRPKAEDKTWAKREAANGVDRTKFLEAVSWCPEPAIRDALLDIFRRTDDTAVMIATLPSIKATHPELILPRFQRLLKALPPTEESPRGDGYDLLVALGQQLGPAAKPEFDRYLKDASVQRALTMCWVFDNIRTEWSTEFLARLLADRRPDGRKGDGRVCDMAAWVLYLIDPSLEFDSDATAAQRDRQIEQMREQLAKKKR